MSYWILWPVGIVLWLALGWAEFAYLEKRGLMPTRKNQITLSLFCYTVASKFPLSVFWAGLMIGLFFGTLSTHFLWHWCPPGSTSAG
jgi:uncharacterized membrane protein